MGRSPNTRHDYCCKIAIALTDRVVSAIAWCRQLPLSIDLAILAIPSTPIHQEHGTDGRWIGQGWP